MTDGGLSEATGYSFDPVTGEFKERYNVNTGKAIKGAAFVSEFSPEGEFVGGYGLPGTPGAKGGTPTGAGGPSGEQKLTIGGGETTKKIEEPKVEGPVVEPTVSETRKEEQKAARKKRRRSLLGEEEEGLLAPANVYRRSLLGV